MKSDELITKVYNLFNNNKYEEAIKISIDNIGLLVSLVGRIIENKKFSQYNLFIKESSELKIKPKNDTEYLLLYSWIILSIMEKYHSLIYYEEEEFNNPKYKVRYPVILADDDLKLNLYLLFMIIFSFEAHYREILSDSHNKQTYVGIDYEFNNRQIATMQLNFERASSKTKKTDSFIWIINPAELNETKKVILIKYLMKNRKIFKILHGADSLDVPYMYYEMFDSDKSTIRDFTSRYIDTRFLCEYFKIHQDDGKKCSIYDALLYFGTISKKQYDNLNDTHDKMGPVQNISWNIHNLKNDLYSLKYALYDVLFLKKYLLDIHNKAKSEAPNFYMHYTDITRLVQFIILERRDTTDITPKLKAQIDKMNNFYFFHEDKKNNLIEVFNKIKDKIKFNDGSFFLSHLLNINYLRTHIIIIVKFLIYSWVCKKFKVFEKKGVIFNKELINSNTFFEDLEIYNLKHLIPFFIKLNNRIKQKLEIIY